MRKLFLQMLAARSHDPEMKAALLYLSKAVPTMKFLELSIEQRMRYILRRHQNGEAVLPRRIYQALERVNNSSAYQRLEQRERGHPGTMLYDVQQIEDFVQRELVEEIVKYFFPGTANLMLGDRTGLDLISFAMPRPMSRLYFTPYTEELTPINMWRRFLWGQGAVLRGRPSLSRQTWDRRLIAYGVHAPAYTFSRLFRFAAMAYAAWWMQRLWDTNPTDTHRITDDTGPSDNPSTRPDPQPSTDGTNGSPFSPSRPSSFISTVDTLRYWTRGLYLPSMLHEGGERHVFIVCETCGSFIAVTETMAAHTVFRFPHSNQLYFACPVCNAGRTNPAMWTYHPCHIRIVNVPRTHQVLREIVDTL